MSEIEKMYKNAGVEKQYYSFDSADGNTYTWELNENGNDKHNMCFIGKPKIKDREFTADKQLELIKWLGELQIDTRKGYWHLAKFGRIAKTIYADNGNLGEALSEIVNQLWQDLTESEQEQIRSLLNG